MLCLNNKQNISFYNGLQSDQKILWRISFLDLFGIDVWWHAVVTNASCFQTIVICMNIWIVRNTWAVWSIRHYCETHKHINIYFSFDHIGLCIWYLFLVSMSCIRWFIAFDVIVFNVCAYSQDKPSQIGPDHARLSLAFHSKSHRNEQLYYVRACVRLYVYILCLMN